MPETKQGVAQRVMDATYRDAQSEFDPDTADDHTTYSGACLNGMKSLHAEMSAEARRMLKPLEDLYQYREQHRGRIRTHDPTAGEQDPQLQLRGQIKGIKDLCDSLGLDLTPDTEEADDAAV